MTGFILGHIYGLGIGTVLAAFTMGKGIAIVGNAMDKHIAIAPYITNHIKHHGSHKAQVRRTLRTNSTQKRTA